MMNEKCFYCIKPCPERRDVLKASKNVTEVGRFSLSLNPDIKAQGEIWDAELAEAERALEVKRIEECS